MNKKYLNFRTDMADERVDTYRKVHNLTDIDGVKVTSNADDGVITTIVDVLNETGEKAVSKKKGKYITIEIKDFNYIDENKKESIQNQVALQINDLIKNYNSNSIMIVGLGNIAITPDALGPKVVQNVEITRHLIKFAKELVEEGTKEISAVSPGVLGTTGIETSEIIQSVISKVKPDLLIVIDSLASQSIHRVGTTIQLSNTGIIPGEGIKNKRDALNQENLGIPVIAIGVPTVVDMATITNGAIDKMIEKTKNEIDEFNAININQKEFIKALNVFEEDTRYDMIANILDTQNYIVTPKEVDELITKMSEIIANGINISLIN
jgi:spore protease